MIAVSCAAEKPLESASLQIELKGNVMPRGYPNQKIRIKRGQVWRNVRTQKTIVITAFKRYPSGIIIDNVVQLDDNWSINTEEKKRRSISLDIFRIYYRIVENAFMPEFANIKASDKCQDEDLTI